MQKEPANPGGNTLICYAITHINQDGMRTLTFANQGRNHYATRAEAVEAMHLYEPDLRSKILGERANTLEVRETDCYDHGDAKGIYFPMKLNKTTGTPFRAVCVSCRKPVEAGGVVDRPQVYADETGTPWQAYYCAECATPILALQNPEVK